MEIRFNDDLCIIAPLCNKIDERATQSILKKISKESRKVAIDLNYVHECSIEFIEALKNCVDKNLGVFNIPSDIFVLFNIMNVDKHVKLYVSEMDFEENSRQILNRKFKLI